MTSISFLFSNLCSETSKFSKIKSDKRTVTYFKNLLKIKLEQNRIYISSLNNLSPYMKTPGQSDWSTVTQPNTQFGPCQRSISPSSRSSYWTGQHYNKHVFFLTPTAYIFMCAILEDTVPKTRHTLILVAVPWNIWNGWEVLLQHLSGLFLQRSPRHQNTIVSTAQSHHWFIKQHLGTISRSWIHSGHSLIFSSTCHRASTGLQHYFNWPQTSPRHHFLLWC